MPYFLHRKRYVTVANREFIQLTFVYFGGFSALLSLCDLLINIVKPPAQEIWAIDFGNQLNKASFVNQINVATKRQK